MFKSKSHYAVINDLLSNVDRKFAELRTNLVNYLSLQLLGKQSCFDTNAAGPPQVAGSPEELFENTPAGEGGYHLFRGLLEVGRCSVLCGFLIPTSPVEIYSSVLDTQHNAWRGLF